MEKITMKKLLFSVLIIAALFTLCTISMYAQLLQPTKSDDIKTLAKNFVNLLSQENYTAASINFDASVSAALPPAKLEETWKTLLTQVGKFKKQAGVRTGKVQGYDVVFVTCEFENSPLDIKVVFNSSKQIAGLFFVPSESKTESKAPSPKASPNEKEVIIGAGEWALHGTLSLPKGNGPFPAVVLVHGSGPNDRNETIGPNKPFFDLAKGLASKGIAVLRYEKRTKEHAAQLAHRKDSITVKEETIDDALLAVSLLRGTKKIDPKKIFVLGHSLGATLVPRIGMRDSTIAGFIAMSGSTRPLEDVILGQVTYILSLDSSTSGTNKPKLEEIKSQIAHVKDPQLSPGTPSSELPLGIPAIYWLDLRGYNPAEVATSLKQPMFILQGERDYQVTMEDFAGWKKFLSDKPNVTFKSYPALNHLYIAGEGKSTPAEYSMGGACCSRSYR